MTAPDKYSIRDAGYKMTANAEDATVSRCAGAVKEAYLLHYVTEAQITAASATDEIGRAWQCLTFLRFAQDVEFGTRTGGEKKRFDYGDHLGEMEALKAEAARRLSALNNAHPQATPVADICRVYFRTQFYK